MSAPPVISEDQSKTGMTEKAGAFFRQVYFLKPKEQRSTADRLKHKAIKVLAVSFWAYCLVTVFFINLDERLTAAVGSPFNRIVEFKAVTALSILALLWLIVGSRDFFFSLFYIGAYPLKVAVWFLFVVGVLLIRLRSWIVVFAVLNAMVELIRSIKVNFIVMTLFLVCALMMVVSSNYDILLICSLTMIGLVVFSYVRGTWRALAPSSVFKLLRTFTKGSNEFRYKGFELEDEIKGKALIELNDEQITKWNNKLQSSVLYNRGLLFYARTLRDYQRSRLPFLPSLFTVFRLLGFTVIGFAFANYALLKADGALYSVHVALKPFHFLYYSFSATLWNSVEEIKAVSPLSQSVLMAQELLSFALVGILISMFISHQSQRASSDLDEAIQAAETEAARMENWIIAEYKIKSIAAAIDYLRQAEANMLKAIAWLSKGL